MTLLFAGIRAATAAPVAAPRIARKRLGVKRRPRRRRNAKRFCRETRNGQKSVNFFRRWYNSVPALLFWPAVALEVIGGVLVLIGYQTRLAALALALFSVLAGLLFHIPTAGMEALAAQNEINHLLKNVAIAGGFLMLAVHGAGALSVDERAETKGRL